MLIIIWYIMFYISGAKILIINFWLGWEKAFGTNNLLFPLSPEKRTFTKKLGEYQLKKKKK